MRIGALLGEENDAIDVTNGNPNGVLAGTQYTLVVDLTSGIVYQNTDGAHAWVVFAPSGGSSTSASGFTTGSPDGTVTGVVGQQLTDTVTGVTWKNYDGGTTWDPTDIPPRWGSSMFIDYVENSIAVASLSGGGSVASIDGEQGRVGIVAPTVTAVNDMASSRTGNLTHLVFGGGRYRFRSGARITALSDGTNNFVVRVGPTDVSASASDAIDSVYLEYDFGTYGDHRWRLCAASNGTRTKTDTGIAATASTTTLTTFQVDVSAGGTVATATINGVAAATPVTTNIPTGAGRTCNPFGFIVIKTLGASARTVPIDWMAFWQVFAVKR